MLKLNEKITFRRIEDSILIITPWDNSMHTLENVGKLIFELLLKKKDSNYIVDKIIEEYDISHEIAKNDFGEFINSLVRREIFIQEV